MKKITVLLSSVLVALFLVSCVPLKPDGSFGNPEFVGKFHGSVIYKVNTPGGTLLYLSVNENSQVESVQTTGKGATAVLTVESSVVGETPLQKLARLRQEYKELDNKSLELYRKLKDQEKIVFGKE